MLEVIQKFHSKLVQGSKWLQSPILLLTRLIWGIQFFQAGLGKLNHLERTANYFQELHIPLPKINALIAGGTECFGGLLLAVGLCSRLISLPLAFTMIVAYSTADADALKSLLQGNPEDFLKADPFPFLFAVLLILFFGPGALSLDRLIDRFFFKGKKSS